MKSINYYSRKSLLDFSFNVFKYFDVPNKDAKLAAEVLDYSDIRGIDSHGIARLHSYFDLLKLKRINPKPILNSCEEF